MPNFPEKENGDPFDYGETKIPEHFLANIGLANLDMAKDKYHKSYSHT
jgi:hypothetical protein